MLIWGSVLTGAGVVFVVCNAGTFIGCVDSVKTRVDNKGREVEKKSDKMTKVDKITKDEQIK